MSKLAERLKTFNADLLPDKVPLKYEAMAANAFAFYRGTCHLFYEDLLAAEALPLSPLAWICGDLHIENFHSISFTYKTRGCSRCQTLIQRFYQVFYAFKTPVICHQQIHTPSPAFSLLFYSLKFR
jgi:hypothetical protein